MCFGTSVKILAKLAYVIVDWAEWSMPGHQHKSQRHCFFLAMSWWTSKDQVALYCKFIPDMKVCCQLKWQFCCCCCFCCHSAVSSSSAFFGKVLQWQSTQQKSSVTILGLMVESASSQVGRGRRERQSAVTFTHLGLYNTSQYKQNMCVPSRDVHSNTAHTFMYQQSS